MAFSRRSRKKSSPGTKIEISQKVKPCDANQADSLNTQELFSLGELDILKVIGTGTFARVCLCRYKVTRKYYALKILAMVDVIKLKQVEHVRNEKNILSQVQHPFIG